MSEASGATPPSQHGSTINSSEIPLDTDVHAGAQARPVDAASTEASAPAFAPFSQAALDRTLARHPRPLGGDPLRRVDKPIHSLTGMILNNQAGSVDHLSPKRKPSWIRARVPGGEGYNRLQSILSENKLHTVCEEAGCPNMGECWSRGVATIMILGDTCTRACGFCNVKTGRPPVLDKDEPRRVAESLRLMYEGAKLKHIVITSVNRDELSDGGAGIWAETIARSREACPGLSIEVLIPDFEGNWPALQMVIDAKPHIINHNLETVRRMYPAVRPSAKFDRSLELLRRVKEQGLVAKTGIMVGIGEKDEEVVGVIEEIQGATRAQKALGTGHQALVPDGQTAAVTSTSAPCPVPSAFDSCDILTIGQYLQPTRNHLPIDRFVTPEQFAEFKRIGLAGGFKVVESGPLVRSSYHADHQADVLTEIQSVREQK